MKKNRIKDSISYRVFSVVNGCFLTLLALLCVIPFVHILAVSFSDAASTAANSVGLLPVGFHLDAFQTMLLCIEHSALLYCVWCWGRLGACCLLYRLHILCHFPKKISLGGSSLLSYSSSRCCLAEVSFLTIF